MTTQSTKRSNKSRVISVPRIGSLGFDSRYNGMHVSRIDDFFAFSAVAFQEAIDDRYHAVDTDLVHP